MEQNEESGASAGAPIPETVNGRECYSVKLERPIKRAGGDIEEVKVMKPEPGDMRGLSLKAIWDMDAIAIMTLLPRVTSPTLVAHEVQAMDIVDIMECGGAVVGFLLPKGVRQQAAG